MGRYSQSRRVYLRRKLTQFHLLISLLNAIPIFGMVYSELSNFQIA